MCLSQTRASFILGLINMGMLINSKYFLERNVTFYMYTRAR
jgi:hypothetical protein